MGQGRGEGRGQQGKNNQLSEYSEGEMKIDGPWQDDKGTVNVLYLLDCFIECYYVDFFKYHTNICSDYFKFDADIDIDIDIDFCDCVFFMTERSFL